MEASEIKAEVPYVGYYWMSDATDPVVLGDEDGQNPMCIPPDLMDTLRNPDANPFVIEAQLYSPTHNLSIGIKYVDGKYVISSLQVPENLSAALGDNITLKRYVAHRMPGRKLLFLQYWKEEKDPLCAGMPVLQPAEMAFVGFERKNDSLYEKLSNKKGV